MLQHGQLGIARNKKLYILSVILYLLRYTIPRTQLLLIWSCHFYHIQIHSCHREGETQFFDGPSKIISQYSLCLQEPTGKIWS